MDAANERILVYRVDDLPAALTGMLPEGAKPRGCLFWLAAESSTVMDELLDRLPEPEIDHVEEGLALCDVVSRVAARSAWLVDELDPADDRVYSSAWQAGFHAGDPDEVLRELEEMSVEILPIRGLLDDVALVEVTDDHGEPVDGMLLFRWIRDEGVGLQVMEPVAPGIYALSIPSLPFTEVALFDDRGRGVDFAPPRGGELVPLRLARVARPPASERPSTPTSPGELAAAIAIVNEVYAEPVASQSGSATTTLRVEQRPDGTLVGRTEHYEDGSLANMAEQEVQLLPRGASFDPVRYRALIAGVQRALRAGDAPEGVMLPDMLLPVELLDVADLATEEDFRRAAFDPEPIAGVRAPGEVGAVLARHGLPAVDSRTAVEVWYLLPATILDEPRTDRAREAAAFLAEQPEGGRLLELVAEEWDDRVLLDGAGVFWWEHLLTEIQGVLASVLPVERVVAAGRRAVARHRARHARPSA